MQNGCVMQQTSVSIAEKNVPTYDVCETAYFSPIL